MVKLSFLFTPSLPPNVFRESVERGRENERESAMTSSHLILPLCGSLFFLLNLLYKSVGPRAVLYSRMVPTREYSFDTDIRSEKLRR